MAQSALERTLQSFRAELLANDEATLSEVMSAYAEVRARLVKRIAELADAMEGAPTVGEILQDERARALLKQVEAEMAALALRSQGPIVAGQEAAVAMAGEHALGGVVAQAEMVGGASAVARIDATWNRLNTGAVEALSGQLSDGSPLDRWLIGFGQDSKDYLSRQMQSAVALGENPRTVARRLEKALDYEGGRLALFARQVTLDSYRIATAESYRENRDISTGEWEWISAADSRTCLSCIYLDGKRFSLDIPFQQGHLGCRCSSMLVLEGIGTPERRLASEWFSGQPEATQRTMVPVTAFDDFKAGRLTLGDFNTVQQNQEWGDRFRQATVTEARQSASSRDRKAA